MVLMIIVIQQWPNEVLYYSTYIAYQVYNSYIFVAIMLKAGRPTKADWLLMCLRIYTDSENNEGTRWSDLLRNMHIMYNISHLV